MINLMKKRVLFMGFFFEYKFIYFTYDSIILYSKRA
jgi:hypothetical protein